MGRDRILIVEDERIISLDLNRRLDRAGYQVVDTVSTGREAIEAAETHRPDLILMDVRLGGEMDGVDAATEIRRRIRIPVIFLTAYADEETIERAKAAEPFGYVLKPFKERELYTTIDIALYKARIDGKLKEQERWNNAILESIGDGIIATDGSHRIRFMNPVAEALTGWTESEAIGTTLNDVLQLRDDRARSMELLTRGAEATPAAPIMFQDVALVNREGDTVHIEGTITDIEVDDGVTNGHVVAFRDVSSIKQMHATIDYQATHDTLTGLLNRDEFVTLLEEAASQAADREQNFCFAYLDLDQFKVVNDVAGHLAGDELLRQVASEIEAHVTHFRGFARLGGDEFALLMGDDDCTEAEEVCRGLLEKLNRPFVWDDHAFTISVSIGLVPVDGRQRDAYELFAAADDACYLAKEEGGNRLKIYETANRSFLVRRGQMQWISRLNGALAEQRFVLYWQPIVPLAKHGEGKREVLIRLQNEDGSLTSPGDFIPAAERYNLMSAIDRWVVTKVIQHIRESDGLDTNRYCINLSGASILDENLLDMLLELLSEPGVDPAQFCFEITETTAIANYSHAVSFVQRLKATGATFALDDFGNGFSSFAYLKQIPVDYLKIDGSFVKGITQDAIDLALVKSVNTIGHILGMRTIAEYVQDEDTRRLLEDIGVDYGQGFYLARPQPLKAAKGVSYTTEKG